MNNADKCIVYRGVSQTRKPITGTSNRKSLAKMYRGAEYYNLPKESHKPCKHTYRGCVYVS